MDQVVEICFKYRHSFHICIVTVTHELDADYYCIQLADAEIVDIFNAADLMYIGDHGYKTLSAFKNDCSRPLLIHLANLASGARQLNNDKYSPERLAINNSNYLKN